ncbi:hypothetical protein [Clostridium tyrobutyricum]|uniref:hypothetical protein n=2 Tax=Clostridium tyrobutyricum TaxID=1519 RepID=UPI001C3D5C9A|nr:hypothetical protein [Clostridium tyrobutyricum]MBV4437220.1 hypothetical protein [Clostridium tyrobutyricum]
MISLCIVKKMNANKIKVKNNKCNRIVLLLILGIFISILLELIFKNSQEASATMITGVIAVVGVYFTIKENQKMRLAQIITKSRIDWMQLMRKYIHEYLGYLNELDNADNLLNKRQISIKLYTVRDKIISYLNPEAAYLDVFKKPVSFDCKIECRYKRHTKSINNKKLCCFMNNLECVYYYCNPDCMLIKELRKLESKELNIEEHKQKIIKITRCYFKVEWERAKWEGYTGNILKDEDIQKDKFDFIGKFDKYFRDYR